MAGLLASLLLLFAALAAGSLAAAVLGRECSRAERAGLGLALGAALLVVSAHLGALAGALSASAALPILALVAFGVVWTRRSAAPVAAGEPNPFAPLALVFAGAWSLTPIALRDMPLGWDPAFHTAIVELLRTQGALPATWAPYEPFERFNYPSGLHAAIALFGRLSGGDSAQLFTVAFVLVGAGALVVLFALAERFSGSRTAAAFAVLVYGLTAGWGTLASHASWGGLPNLTGLLLMMGFWLAVQHPGRAPWLAAAFLAAATAFVHHLSFALLGFSVGCLLALELLSERRLSAPARSAFKSMLLATL
ncbi:MAG: hypothetical protein ACK4N5_26795, partial [Myxococcales bacterium]